WMAGAIERQGRRLRRANGVGNAPIARVSNQLFLERRAVPALDVNGGGVASQVGQAVVKPEQIEPAANGSKLRPRRAAVRGRDATAGIRAGAGGDPVVAVEFGGIDFAVPARIVLPGCEQSAAEVRQADCGSPARRTAEA